MQKTISWVGDYGITVITPTDEKIVREIRPYKGSVIKTVFVPRNGELEIVEEYSTIS